VSTYKDIQSIIQEKDRALFKEAWNIARKNHGDLFTFYLPGMIRYGNIRGLYPAISLTGNSCELLCEHCKGLLLKPMIKANDPEILLNKCLNLANSGRIGILLSGGSDHKGKLPWEKFVSTISKIKVQTNLFISVHSGFVDYNQAIALKDAGVDQALIDVMGDDETAQDIYHLEGLKTVTGSLEYLLKAGIEVVPHVVSGLMYGKIHGEYNALRIIKDYNPAAVVIVVLTPLKGTPMSNNSPPSPIEVARLVAAARLIMPFVPLSLGCERPRNTNGQIMEEMSLYAGATRMAIWSDKTVETAINLGLKPLFQKTCCSVPYIEKLNGD
jgi:lipoyl synthase